VARDVTPLKPSEKGAPQVHSFTGGEKKGWATSALEGVKLLIKKGRERANARQSHLKKGCLLKANEG